MVSLFASLPITSDRLGQEVGSFLEPTLLYSELRQQLASILSDGTATRQRLANLSSALNRFQRHVRVNDASRVGPELRARFEHYLGTYVDELRAAGASDTAIRDQRSMLRRWHELARQRVDANTKVVVSPLRLTLERLLKAQNMHAGDLARQCNVPEPTLRGWLRGGVPNRRSGASLRRIASQLGVDPSVLIDKVPTLARKATAQPIAYRTRLSHLTRDRYLLPKAQVTEALRDEWQRFLQYKCATFPGLERQLKGAWRLRPAIDMPPQLRTWWTMPNAAEVAPSADIAFQSVRAFLGALAKRRADDGVTDDLRQSLAHFSDVRKVAWFVDFLRARGDGRLNQGIGRHVQFALSLVHPITGYLTQQPKFAELLSLSADEWEGHCAKAFVQLRKLRIDLDRRSTVCRSSWDPIRPLLACDYPLLPVFQALEAYRTQIDTQRSKTRQWALAVRDYALLTLLLANPLRALNFKSMRFQGTDHVHLQRDGTGKWHFNLRPEDFKNCAGAARNKPYQVAVAPWAVPALELWLYEAREVLEVVESDFVFISSRHTLQGSPWKNLNRAVFSFTRNIVPQTGGFSPHTVRHLVATTFLRARPGAYRQVADLLHDELQTVLDHYGHVDTARGLADYASMVERLYSETLSPRG